MADSLTVLINAQANPQPTADSAVDPGMALANFLDQIRSELASVEKSEPSGP